MVGWKIINEVWKKFQRSKFFWAVELTYKNPRSYKSFFFVSAEEKPGAWSADKLLKIDWLNSLCGLLFEWALLNYFTSLCAVFFLLHTHFFIFIHVFHVCLMVWRGMQFFQRITNRQTDGPLKKTASMYRYQTSHSNQCFYLFRSFLVNHPLSCFHHFLYLNFFFLLEQDMPITS